MLTPTEIKLHQQSRVMEIVFDDGRSFRLPYLCQLGVEQETRWTAYLKQIEAAGVLR